MTHPSQHADDRDDFISDDLAQAKADHEIAVGAACFAAFMKGVAQARQQLPYQAVDGAGKKLRHGLKQTGVL